MNNQRNIYGEENSHFAAPPVSSNIDQQNYQQRQLGMLSSSKIPIRPSVSYKKHPEKVRKVIKASKDPIVHDIVRKTCSNCFTETTPLWRKGDHKEILWFAST